MNQTEYIKEKIETLGISVSDEQCEKLLRFYEMLVEKNKVMNLTAITEFEDVVTKHFMDSASIVMPGKLGEEKIVKLLSSGCRVLDLGTGAGFPGIPLKILFPNLKITLMDSLNKRLVFLDEVIADLGLKNIKTVHARAEEFALKPDYREQYDLVVSRAVANLSLLSELCLGFVKPGGHFVPYKAGGSEEEIKAAEKAVSVMGGKQLAVYKFKLPGTELERTMPVIRKITSTPGKYPRNGKKLGVF